VLWTGFVVGGLGFVVGALEGFLVGLLLIGAASNANGLMLLLALDRAAALGLVGFGLGAVAGALRWVLRRKAQTPGTALVPSNPEPAAGTPEVRDSAQAVVGMKVVVSATVMASQSGGSTTE
jgi:hypothetical protein